MHFELVETALGTCGIVHRNSGARKVLRIFLPDTSKNILSKIHSTYPGCTRGSSSDIDELIKRIREYFEGTPIKFSLDSIDTSICYPFQQQVIRMEHTIPHGMTASYSWIAQQIGTKAVRAVGNALARNPFPIIIPCHRAIRSDRTLGGFQGGLAMKRQLLEMEGVQFDRSGKVNPENVLTRNS
jgi:methylated-DNA-[protein]-cysteine S-methyltransferase